MAQNIEIKARLQDWSSARQRIASFASSGPFLLPQRDTYFHCHQGRLKLREYSGSTELIWYQRSNEAAIRPSNYYLTTMEDPQGIKQILSQALGVETVVEKSRELWWYENVRIHLDQVRELGDFIEFEGIVDQTNLPQTAAQRVQWLLEQMEVTQDCWLAQSYRELMLERGC